MHDWMRTVREPTSYRVGNTRFSIHRPYLAMALLTTCLLFYIVIFYKTPAEPSLRSSNTHDLVEIAQFNHYNSVYPLSAPLRSQTHTEFRVALIADMDTNSKKEDSFVSYLLRARLRVSNDRLSVTYTPESVAAELHSAYAYGDRGMELSELVVFNGRLYTCDDRTGIVYEVLLRKKLLVMPWIILPDGDGLSSNKGFKCEWMSVKDGVMYVGGLGKEWTTTTGELVNRNPQWIKIVQPSGFVTHKDWSSVYDKIRAKAGFSYPGYMIFESGVWSDVHRSWFFMPRRASAEPYDEKLDEKRATNLLVKADADFDRIKVMTIGEVNPIRGYSSFKFVPYTDDEIIVALKSEESNGQISSYISVFRISGEMLLHDTLVSNELKYEGIEFI